MLLRYVNAVTRQEEWVPVERVIRIRDRGGDGGALIDVETGGRPMIVEAMETAAGLLEALVDAGHGR